MHMSTLCKCDKTSVYVVHNLLEEADSLTINEEFNALPLEGSSSVVWKYFGFKESNGKFVGSILSNLWMSKESKI